MWIGHEKNVLQSVVVAVERGAAAAEGFERTHRPRLPRPNVQQAALTSHLGEFDAAGFDRRLRGSLGGDVRGGERQAHGAAGAAGELEARGKADAPNQREAPGGEQGAAPLADGNTAPPAARDTAQPPTNVAPLLCGVIGSSCAEVRLRGGGHPTFPKALRGQAFHGEALTPLYRP